MMSSMGNEKKEDSLENNFHQLAMEDQESVEIPKKPENRRKTNMNWLFISMGVIVLMIPFLVYTLIHSDRRKLLGSDNCGNFCGYKNKKYDQWACTGKDYTDKNTLFLSVVTIDGKSLPKFECVSSCPTSSSKECLSLTEVDSSLKEIEQNVVRGWWVILVSAIVTFLLCFGAMFLFRYAVRFTVWFIIIGTILLLLFILVVGWFAFFVAVASSSGDSKSHIEVFPVILLILVSIIVLIPAILLMCMIKRVKLIIALFREATKAIFDIPSLFVMPIFSSILITLTCFVFIALYYYTRMAGILTEMFPDHLVYSFNFPMIVCRFYVVTIFIWFINFIKGSQYMVIAGAISAWFFTRNKTSLNSPIWTSFTNLIHFHLGTVAVGSLVISLMNFVRSLITADSKGLKLFQCCVENAEEFVKFLSKNAYIHTAMHGWPFFQSGKKAAKLLMSNAANVIALNSIGDYVLVIAQLLVIVVGSIAGVFIALATGYAYSWVIAVICVLDTIFITSTFFSVFEATIDCIFICFCEDMNLNDGIAKPYFMSKRLMHFVEESKAVMPKKEIINRNNSQN